MTSLLQLQSLSSKITFYVYNYSGNLGFENHRAQTTDSRFSSSKLSNKLFLCEIDQFKHFLSNPFFCFKDTSLNLLLLSLLLCALSNSIYYEIFSCIFIHALAHELDFVNYSIT